MSAPNRPTSSIGSGSGPQGTVVERTTPIGELPQRDGRPARPADLARREVPLHDHRPRPAGRQVLEVRARAEPTRSSAKGISLGYFPGVDRRHARRALLAFGELQPARRHGAVDGVGRLHADGTEVARIVTCTMPHGSRIDPGGTRQYSTCMMDDQLVEIDTRKFEVSRRFSLAKGKEGPIAGRRRSARRPRDAGAARPAPKPTVDPAEVGYRAGRAPRDGAGDVLADLGAAVGRWQEDLRRVQQGRRDPRGRPRRVVDHTPSARRAAASYNLAVTPDGKLLVATLKQGGMVEVFDLASGKSVCADEDLDHARARRGGEPRLALRVRQQRRRRLRAGQSRCLRSPRARHGRRRRRRTAGERDRVLEDGESPEKRSQAQRLKG